MAKKSTKIDATAEATLTTYKGFGKDWKCNPGGVSFQYEIGATYKTDKQVVRCGAGAFHSVLMPLDAWNYYGPATSKFASTSVGGKVVDDPDGDSKIASAEITINAELRLPEFIRAAVKWIVDAAKESVTTGYRAHAASTGNGAHAASTGNGAHAASTGYRAHAASTGDYAHAASTGDYAHAASTGDYAHAASTGNGAHAASTGNGAHAASTGNGAHAASTGNGALSAALGARSTAKAEVGGGIVLAAYDETVFPAKLVAVRASLVGQNGIEAGKSYRLTTAGEFEIVE
ncbi:hypothetical protein [Rhizobium sp. SG741]|uniref:DUF7666 domain-containing protein n=1 Tax=Rhizobium sp. SG741 TaxID=2587114 RepID=UPI0014474E2D|nr:hypothetical protein [Rhizobium sp. SG741]NKJ03094.1 hypothetical protein [Rhizobium sp. SG741]